MEKVVVSFTNTQGLENKEGFLENVELINSDKGVELYGFGAYLVNKEWLEKVENGEIPEKKYSEKEIINGLKYNNSYPIEPIV